jgi:hypothetical protein
MTIAVLVLAWTVSGGFAALIAHNQGRAPGWYTVGGLLLGPVGVLIAAFTTPGDVLTQRAQLRTEAVKARSAATPWMDADGR